MRPRIPEVADNGYRFQEGVEFGMPVTDCVPTRLNGTRGASTTTELVFLIAGGVLFEIDLILLLINPFIAKYAASFSPLVKPNFPP